MKLLFLLLLNVLCLDSAPALECSVNELSLVPLNIKMSGPLRMCIEGRRGKGACVSQNRLRYGPLAISLNQKTGGCGFKGSELRFEQDKIFGTLKLCSDDTESSSSDLPGLPCFNGKSDDGKFNLTICTDTRGVMTLAIPAPPAAQTSGFLLSNIVGNSFVLTVNSVTCGESRVRTPLKSKEQAI